MIKLLQLIIAILISQSAGLVGSVFTVKSVSIWYAVLNKPSFNPPGWLFGPVWILLYTLMGISSYLIWQEREESKLVFLVLVIFGIQLALNALWSFLFFGLQNPGLAFAEIIVLWIFILITILLFYKINHLASYLLIPYILWVSFAMVLNFYIWRLN